MIRLKTETEKLSANDIWHTKQKKTCQMEKDTWNELEMNHKCHQGLLCCSVKWCYVVASVLVSDSHPQTPCFWGSGRNILLLYQCSTKLNVAVVFIKIYIKRVKQKKCFAFFLASCMFLFCYFTLKGMKIAYYFLEFEWN